MPEGFSRGAEPIDDDRYKEEEAEKGMADDGQDGHGQNTDQYKVAND
jgi:hypothetical protein